MTLRPELARALTNLFPALRRNNEYPALAGDGNGNVHAILPNGQPRTGYIYARIQLSMGVSLTQVICRTVAPAHNQPIIVGRTRFNNDYEVLGEDAIAAIHFWGTDNPNTGNLPLHAQNHMRLGVDPLFVQSLQFIHLLTYVDSLGSPTVGLSGWFYKKDDGTYEAYDGESIDLTSYIPTGDLEQRLVITALDRDTNTATVIAADPVAFEFSPTGYVPFTSTDVKTLANSLATDNLTLSAAVRLYTGQGIINTTDIWYDCRQMIATGVGAVAETFYVLAGTDFVIAGTDSVVAGS